MCKCYYSSSYIYQQLEKLYPDAHCQLNYQTIYQLAVAVMLSAQTTDVAVNKVTPTLFNKYPDAESMALANGKDVEEIIHSLGLYRNKASNIIKMSQELVKNYQGEVPQTMEELTKLPGVGRKSANVILAEGFGQPAIAVDTHVHRVSARLGISSKKDSPEETEAKLRAYFPQEEWIKLHHLMIFFGRNQCFARNPACQACPFREHCCYWENDE